MEDLIVQFTPPEDAEAIRLEIEDEENGYPLKADLPGDAENLKTDADYQTQQKLSHQKWLQKNLITGSATGNAILIRP